MITLLLALLGFAIGVVLLGIGVVIGNVVKNLLEQKTFNEIRRDVGLQTKPYHFNIYN